MKIAYISTWFPTRCGLANFSNDLSKAVARAGRGTVTWGAIAYAIDSHTRYGKEVDFIIDARADENFFKAAEFINTKGYDVVSLQHEFRSFGPDEHRGKIVLELCKRIKKPIIATLHHIVTPPTFSTQALENTLRIQITRELSMLCSSLIVMTKQAVEHLVHLVGIPREKIQLVPHGCHRFCVTKSHEELRTLYGLPKEKLIFGTTGLFFPEKGLEYQIEAFARLVEKRQDCILWICGVHHPKLDRQKKYVHRIKEKVRALGLQQHIFFNEKFFSLQTFGEVFALIDIYLNTNLWERGQADSSGSLSFALGMGKSIISTTFVHAQEAIGKDRGILVPFRDTDALYRAMVTMATDTTFRVTCAEKAYQYAEDILWPQIGTQYYELFKKIKT